MTLEEYMKEPVRYEVVEYIDTLDQLSDLIYARSVVMIQEYENRLKQMASNNSRKL